MKKWECPCGYIYDPAEGDYENGIEAGTAFEDVTAHGRYRHFKPPGLSAPV